MKLKRIAASINASFEDLVSKVENHQALADCAIKDVRQSAAKIRAQLNSTHHKLEQLEVQLESVKVASKKWRKRALDSKNTDKEKALECLRAANRADDECKQLEAKKRQEVNNVHVFEGYLREVESQLSRLQSRRDKLSARDARNTVAQYAQESSPNDDVEMVFSRWEQSVLSDEYRSFPSISPEEKLEREFVLEEERIELEEQLRELAGDQEDESNDK